MKQYLLFFFILISCSKSYQTDTPVKDIHDQLSTDVEITLTEKGNIKEIGRASCRERV